MINRDCAIIKLLNENDANIRVTMYDYSSVSENPCDKKDAWIEMIRNTLGDDVVGSTDSLKVSISNENEEIVAGKIAGTEIPELVRIICDDPIPMRIAITANEQKSVWIFA